MRIGGIDRTPVLRIGYETVDKRGRRVVDELPVFHGVVDQLPDGLDGLVCVGDLQGRCSNHRRGLSGRLLGEVVAEKLGRLYSMGVFGAPGRLGVLLTGDYYIPGALNGRGGNGDVRSVWRAFARRFGWVAGVAGNHDGFGSRPGTFDGFAGEEGVTCVDGGTHRLSGLRVGGVSGVIGPASRPFRKDKEGFVALTKQVIWSRPDVMLFHEGPTDRDCSVPGNPAIRNAITAESRVLCLMGHSHWEEPLRELPNGAQLLNLDGRAVLLSRG